MMEDDEAKTWYTSFWMLVKTMTMRSQVQRMWAKNDNRPKYVYRDAFTRQTLESIDVSLLKLIQVWTVNVNEFVHLDAVMLKNLVGLGFSPEMISVAAVAYKAYKASGNPQSHSMLYVKESLYVKLAKITPTTATDAEMWKLFCESFQQECKFESSQMFLEMATLYATCVEVLTLVSQGEAGGGGRTFATLMTRLEKEHELCYKKNMILTNESFELLLGGDRDLLALSNSMFREVEELRLKHPRYREVLMQCNMASQGIVPTVLMSAYVEYQLFLQVVDDDVKFLDIFTDHFQFVECVPISQVEAMNHGCRLLRYPLHYVEFIENLPYCPMYLLTARIAGISHNIQVCLNEVVMHMTLRTSPDILANMHEQTMCCIIRGERDFEVMCMRYVIKDVGVIHLSTKNNKWRRPLVLSGEGIDSSEDLGVPDFLKDRL